MWLLPVSSQFSMYVSLLVYATFSLPVGADIEEMSVKSFFEVTSTYFPGEADSIANLRKPILAAVNGYAVRAL